MEKQFFEASVPNSESGRRTSTTRKGAADPKKLRDFILSLGNHEADAMAACMVIAENRQDDSAVKKSDRRRLNLYLNSETNKSNISADELITHRRQRAQHLLTKVLDYLEKEEMITVMFTVNSIASNPGDIESGIRMIQFYNTNT